MKQQWKTGKAQKCSWKPRMPLRFQIAGARPPGSVCDREVQRRGFHWGCLRWQWPTLLPARPDHKDELTLRIPSPGQLCNPTPRRKIPHPEPPAAVPRRFTARTRGLRGAPDAAVPGVPSATRETPSPQARGPRLSHPSATRLTQTSPAARGAVIAPGSIPPRPRPRSVSPSLLGTLRVRAPRKDRTQARAHAPPERGELREPRWEVVSSAVAGTAAPQPAAAS